MFPLGYFLIAWILLLALYAFLVLLTLTQMLRHGLPTRATYVSTSIFLIVVVAVVLGTGFYLIGVDWTERVNVLPEGFRFFLGGAEMEVSL
jgi:hypothetical protein